MMTNRENILSLFKRKGYERMPIDFSMCPSLVEQFKEKTGTDDYKKYFDFSFITRSFDLVGKCSKDYYKKYYSNLKPDTFIDKWGVAHEKGSESAKHMTKLVYPLAGKSADEIKEYPFLEYIISEDISEYTKIVDDIKKQDKFFVGQLGQTIWERAWSIRSMEDLFVDMMTDPDLANYILDKQTESSLKYAELYAKCGADAILIGDDIGMQRSIMMSHELYNEYLKPRTTAIISAAKKIKPDILIMYHSCGFITPFIPDLIEIGVDILNPVQPECMDFKEIHAMYGNILSFHGTIGTQSTMPFGSPEDVKREVFRNLDIAGPKGGLLCAPTHLLEPEVPLDNIFAYVDACRSYNL